jgi:ankyrin repeat protein
VSEVSKLIELEDANALLEFVKFHPELANERLYDFPIRGGEVEWEKLIHQTCSMEHFLPVTLQLLDYGVSVDERGAEGRTPLHYAAWHGNLEPVPLLLERGANIEARDALGSTSLDLTYRGCSKDVYEYLLTVGAKPGLLIAMAKDRFDILEKLIVTETREELLSRVFDSALLKIFAGKGTPEQAERKLQILDELGLG